MRYYIILTIYSTIHIIHYISTQSRHRAFTDEQVLRVIGKTPWYIISPVYNTKTLFEQGVRIEGQNCANSLV